jgi:hypothetical protein
VQRRLGLGDLYLGGGHATSFGPLSEPAGKERLARAVLAAYRFEGCPADRDAVECERVVELVARSISLEMLGGK